MRHPDVQTKEMIYWHLMTYGDWAVQFGVIYGSDF